MAKQGEMFDLSHPASKPLMDLAKRWVEADGQRKEWKADLDKLEQQMAAIMHKQNLPDFRLGGTTIQIVPGKETVKVRMRPDGEEAK